MAIRRLCGRLLEVLIHVHISTLAVAPLYPTCTLKHTLCDCTEAIDTHPTRTPTSSEDAAICYRM